MRTEYIVTLWNHADLDDFYAYMETRVDCHLCVQRPLSRSTHYMLTDEEAAELRQDSRIRAVEVAGRFEISKDAFTLSGVFDKSDYSPPNGQTSRNWCLYRARNTLTDDPNQVNWYSGTSIFDTSTSTANEELSGSVTFTETGRNVDIVVCDGHIDPAQPEMQVNADGTGGSRVVQVDWSNYNATVQGDNPSLGTSSLYFFNSGYTYTPYTSSTNADYNDNMNHGAQAGIIAAGNRQGWAPSANVYNICCYSSVQRTLGNIAAGGTVFYTLFDYIRAWHNSKSVNPATGCKNPTIVNCSFGYTLTVRTDDNPKSWPYWANADGTEYGNISDPNNELTNNEIENAKIASSFFIDNDPNGNGDGNRQMILRAAPTSVISDVEDCINDGIHIVISAGNSNGLMKADNDPKKTAFVYQSSADGTVYHHTRSFAPTEGAILVGALSGYATATGEKPAWYTNRGRGVDIYAFGDGCTAGLNADNFDNSYNITDSRNTNYYMSTFNGTSCAAPQITGILAGILERNPDYTPAQAKADLIARGQRDGEVFAGTGSDWPSYEDYSSGESPVVAMKTSEIRPESGRLETKNYRGARGTSGAVYPRKAANTYRTRT